MTSLTLLKSSSQPNVGVVTTRCPSPKLNPSSASTPSTESIESKLEKLNLKLLENKLFQSNRHFYLSSNTKNHSISLYSIPDSFASSTSPSHNKHQYHTTAAPPPLSTSPSSSSSLSSNGSSSSCSSSCSSRSNSDCGNSSESDFSSANLSSSGSSLSNKAKKMVRFADTLGFELVTIRCVSTNQLVPPNNKLRRHMSDEDDSSGGSSLDDEDLFSSEDEELSVATNLSRRSFVPIDSPIPSPPHSPETSTPPNTPTLNFASSSSSNPDTFIYDNLIFTWHCLFEQPGISPDFYTRLNANKVLLESIYSTHMRLNGVVRVLNLSFVKRVFIRYTINNWQTYTDLDCQHLSTTTTTTTTTQNTTLDSSGLLYPSENSNNNNKLTDRFVFSVLVDKSQAIASVDDTGKMSRPQQLPQLKFEFAVCYVHGDVAFWDNNWQKNYQYDCCFKIKTSPTIN